MPTITAEISAQTITPDLIMPWSTRQTSANIFHDIQGSDTPWVSLQGARKRSGELRLFFAAETDAEDARTKLSASDTFTIDYAARPSLEFTFAVDGDITVELDENTQDHWTVQFGYREVT